MHKLLEISLSLYFFVPQWLCGHESIMQNKANFKMGKIAISIATIKAYANEQRTMNNEHCSKQTQSKPISNAETLQWCEKSHPTGLTGISVPAFALNKAGVKGAKD